MNGLTAREKRALDACGAGMTITVEKILSPDSLKVDAIPEMPYRYLNGTTGGNQTMDATPAPTPEQQDIVDAYLGRLDLLRARKPAPPLVINAYAGSGKTWILKRLANANPRVRFRYLAYNAAAAKEANDSFPVNAKCSTSHSLAHGPMIHMAKRVHGAPKFVGGAVLARQMKLTGPTRLTEDRVLAPGQLASVVKATIMKFCYSADEAITRKHVPADTDRFEPAEIAALREIVPPIARRVWEQDITKEGGVVHMQHDYYLKAYALTHPRIDGHVIALDEAQDSNPCVAQMIREQIGHGLLVIVTGDTFQAIYGWRGAKDAMRDFARIPGADVLSLTQSFRFGPAVAAEGNKWLKILGADKELRGFGQIRSRVGNVSGHGDAVLCRTNAEALKRAIAAMADGLKVAFPKGTGELVAMCKGAKQIKDGVPCEHPDLMVFATWQQVQDFAEHEADGKDLKQFVDLVDEHGIDELFEILSQIGNEEKGFKADIVISTAHMAKGREWRQVTIADDFSEPKKTDDGGQPRIPRDMAMLAYVAVTRAQYVLDNTGLAWVDNYLGAAAEDAEDEDDEPQNPPEQPAAKKSATMTVTADPDMLAAIKGRIAEWFPGATVELGAEVVAAG